MKVRAKLGSAATPDGGEIVLFQHDRAFSIMVNNQELMDSRQHESELELARLGCAPVVNRETPCILVGGLGLGYTLRQTLDMVGPDAKVVVSELMDAVVQWSRDFFGELNGHPLSDERVEVVTGDVLELILRSEGRFDAILLDVDNGPRAMTDAGNHRLYGYAGIEACRQALREQGCLAVWSAEPDKDYEQLLVSCGFQVRRYRVASHPGSKAQSRFVWVASENQANLPPGGSEPRQSAKQHFHHKRQAHER